MGQQRFLTDDEPRTHHQTQARHLPDQQPTGPFGQRGPAYHQAVYSISVAAQLVGLHPQTLRTYEREELLHPERTAGNTRQYSQADIDRLRFIRHLTQEEGLTLSGVRIVLNLTEQLDDARKRIRQLENQQQPQTPPARQQTVPPKQLTAGTTTPSR